MAAAMGGPLKAVLAGRSQYLALAGAGIVLGSAILPPFATLLGETLTITSLDVARPWILLARSSALAAAVTALAFLIGIPLGVLIGRTDLGGRRIAAALHVFPMFLPPFLLALGWFQILGRAGPFGSEVLSRALFSEAGMIMVLGFAFAPVVTSLTALALLGIDASLEEAARSMARPVRVVTRILLPSVAPALALAGIIVFALAFSELGVPMFLRVDVFPAAVFARLGGIAYAPGEAVALVLPLLPVALLLLVVERRFAGSRSFALLGLRNRGADRFALGRSRFAVSAAVALVAALSIAPLAALALRAWIGGGFAAAGEWLGRAPLNSLLTAAAAATLVTAVGIVAGHAAARGIPGARWLDGLAILAFVTPATLLGVGLIRVWNRPATQAVYASLAIVVLGFVARYAAVGLRAMAVAVTQSPPSLEEAAAACGAHYPRRLLGIVLPMHQRGIAFAWLLALVFCLRDLETAVLFYPAGREPLTVRLLTLEANGPEPVVAALSVVHASMTGGVLLLAGLTFSRRAAV